ncbi:rab3 GTPase-activating protein catalytic subunit [Trichonephila clavipes]|nr:rab3 GTPase-activating protein catalytic subunit [Trichonephila clavipes]
MWNVTDWQNVVFSDESQFVLGTDDNRVRVWRRPELDELGEDITPTDIGRLPCGAIEDPILEFHLSVTWPCFFENTIIDNDVHSDLNPVLSPKWSMRMKTSEKPVCSMADYLKEFSNILLGYYSENQLLGNVPPDDNDMDVTQALDKLAHPNVLPTLLSQGGLRRPSRFQDQWTISEEVLIKILQYIFPDSAPTPAEPKRRLTTKEIQKLLTDLEEEIFDERDSETDCELEKEEYCDLEKEEYDLNQSLNLNLGVKMRLPH